MRFLITRIIKYLISGIYDWESNFSVIYYLSIISTIAFLTDKYINYAHGLDLHYVWYIIIISIIVSVIVLLRGDNDNIHVKDDNTN